MKKNILNIKNLSKTYYTKDREILSLNNISLNIPENSIISIVGPSGCGKSTLLNIIGGLDKKTSGNVMFYENKNRIGYMFQTDALFPWLSILDNCLIGLRVQKKITKNDIEYVKKLLDDYGLHDFIYSYPSNLSGGMRQRVALIRTLAIKPDILLLDEPFSALDYNTKLKVSEDVYRIIRKEEKTTIIITHDVGEAIAMSDKVVVLSGRPAVVKKIYNIDMDEDGPTERRTSNKFNEYYKNIWENIDNYE